MAHSWLVVDVGEALALHKLKLLMLVPRYTLKKGALSIGTWGQVRGQLSVKFFEDVRLGRRWNILNEFVLIPGALAVIAQILLIMIPCVDVVLVRNQGSLGLPVRIVPRIHRLLPSFDLSVAASAHASCSIRPEDNLTRVVAFQLALNLQSSVRVRVNNCELSPQALLDLFHWLIREVHRIIRHVLFLLDTVGEAQVLRDRLLARAADHRCASGRT